MATIKVKSKKLKVKSSITKKSDIKQAAKVQTSLPGGVSRRTAIIALIVAVIIILGVIFRSQIIVATVNGQPITRFALIAELEKESGKKTLDVLITKNLILQDAQTKNITVSDAEIKTETKNIEDNLKKQGQDLNSLLAAQGMSQAELKDQVMLQILVKKLLVKEIAVSDKEVNDYITKNKEAMPKDVSEKDLQVQVRSQLGQQKLSDASNKLVTSLREKAKINYFLNF